MLKGLALAKKYGMIEHDMSEIARMSNIERMQLLQQVQKKYSQVPRGLIVGRLGTSSL